MSLPVGDYIVARGVGVERKTVADLHRSLLDGRLWHQIASLRRDLDSSYLLIEGEDLDRGSISPAGVRGAMLQAADLGVTVVRSINPDDSSLWLERLASRRRNAGVPRVRRRARARPPVTSSSVLCQVPGISPGLAELLLERFGDIGRIATTSAEELMAIPWIGPTRAAAIRRLLANAD